MKRPNVRDVFRVDILRSSLVTDGTRVLLLHMATVATVDQAGAYGGHPMTDSGRIRVSREELADALGIEVGHVSDRIRKATSAGLLRKVAGGRNGQTTTYQAQPRGHAKGTGYTGPASLCGFVNVPEGGVVGTPVGVPGEASKGAVGTPASAPYARAHYSTDDAAQQTAPDEARAERPHGVTEQDGNYRGWHHPASRRSSLAGSSELLPGERPTGEVA